MVTSVDSSSSAFVFYIVSYLNLLFIQSGDAVLCLQNAPLHAELLLLIKITHRHRNVSFNVIDFEADA